MNDREHPSISYLRTAAHNRLVGRLKNAAQLREALVLHLEHYVRPRRAVVVEIIIVTHQLLRATDVRAKYRVGLHTHGGHDGNDTCEIAGDPRRMFGRARARARGCAIDMYINISRCQILATLASRGRQSCVVLIIVEKNLTSRSTKEIVPRRSTIK